MAKRVIKLAVSTLLVLLVLLPGLWLLFRVAVDSDRIKTTLANAVHERTQRTLLIEGEIGLSLWPDIAITLGPTRLTDADGQGELVSFNRLGVAIELMPLFDRRVEVKRIELDELHVTLQRADDGRLNIDDLLHPDTSNVTPPAANAWQLAGVGEVRLNNARVTWRDASDGSETTIRDLNIDCGRIASEPDLRIERPRVSLTADAGERHYQLMIGAPQLAVSDEGSKTLSLDGISGTLAIEGKGLRGPARLDFNGSLNSSLAPPAVTLLLNGKLDAASLRLALGVTRFSPPDIAFDLAIDRLDLDRYLSPDPQNEDAGGTDLRSLTGWKAVGTLRIGELQGYGVTSRDVRLTLGGS